LQYSGEGQEEGPGRKPVESGTRAPGIQRLQGVYRNSGQDTKSRGTAEKIRKKGKDKNTGTSLKKI